ncbi:MAG: hemin uptake protein HemP [Alphaproteobacteria bacterium]
MPPTLEPCNKDDGRGTARVVSSRDLLGQARELIIVHGGERYRLLLTRSNKLILTK